MILILLAGIGLLLLIILIVMPAFKIAPFAYGASRLRASRSRFISKKELKNLAHLGYHDSLVAIDEKKQLHLSKLVSEAFPEEKVQRKIKEYRIECMYKVIQYTPNTYKPFFKALLGKETLEFITGMIRVKLSPGYTDLVAASMFIDKKFSAEKFSVLSLDELLTELEKTSFGETIAKYHANILKGNLEAFEKELNVQYYSKLHAAANDSVLKKCARRVVDIHNVKQALCFGPFEPISGGSLSEETIATLLKATSIQEVKQALELTYFAQFIADESTVTEMFKGLYRAFGAYADGLAMQQPLSLNQMVAYYVNNLIEIKNLRILLKLSHAKFDPVKIEEAFI